MAKKSLRHTLAGLSIAGLIAGAGVALPGSSFGASGCGGPSGCGGASGCGGGQSGAANGTPPSTIPMEEMKEEMTPPPTPELQEEQKDTAPETQQPVDSAPEPDSDKK